MRPREPVHLDPRRHLRTTRRVQIIAIIMLVYGNWKMNLDLAGAIALARGLREELDPAPAGVRVAVFPPLPFIKAVADEIGSAPILTGAQNCWHEPKGAFTGEVAPAQLASVGAKAVLVGHSERRHVLGEDDELIKKKLVAALGARLSVVLCCGETLDERNGGRADAVVRGQIESAFAGLTTGDLDRTVIAYEPVWAIGTGRTASAAQAAEMHAVVRETLARRFGDEAGRDARVLYGGSVNEQNAAELMGAPGVDGALVGGASLKVDGFAAIARAAATAAAAAGAA